MPFAVYLLRSNFIGAWKPCQLEALQRPQLDPVIILHVWLGYAGRPVDTQEALSMAGCLTNMPRADTYPSSQLGFFLEETFY